ncbi:MAG: putative methyltransferase YcgJ [Candidatus Heimdallarchaeota archaeon LC_3]|nr:MAG: putative methyltransferase YcgJ [Candidatus Heimdallarchaeota archaeon LC_3]
MDRYFIEFDDVTCIGCITAVEEKLSNLKESSLKKTDKSTGNSILESMLMKNQISKSLESFEGCCSSCQITIKTIKPITGKDDEIILSADDPNVLTKKQYKQALERIIAKEEVACSDYCVCKTTDIDRFEEFSEAPSFSSIFNLVEYLEKFGYLHFGMSVIDFGSGTGHDAFQIAPLIAPSQITGIDITPEMVDFAKKTAQKLNLPNAVFHQASNLMLVKPESQDLILVNNVFNLLSNKRDFLQQVRTCLKADGVLVMADEFTIDILPESLRNDPAFQCGGIADAQSLDFIITLCQENGFKVLREETIRTYEIKYNKKNYQLNSGILIFHN